VHLPPLRRSHPAHPETSPTASGLNEEERVTTRTHGIATPADLENESRVTLAARHLYEAELALHDAHQSHVKAWIAATSDKLHQAVVEHLAATREQDGSDSRRARPAARTTR
jgi:hypothetical protein